MNPTRQDLFVSIEVIHQCIALLADDVFFRLPFLKIHTEFYIITSQRIYYMKTIIIGPCYDKILTKSRHIKFVFDAIVLKQAAKLPL